MNPSLLTLSTPPSMLTSLQSYTNPKSYVTKARSSKKEQWNKRLGSFKLGKADE